jgi:hypothetical protein
MMSPIRTVFVCRDPLALEYSHERIVAKKKAPTTSYAMARCVSVAFAFGTTSTTATGRACCWFG